MKKEIKIKTGGDGKEFTAYFATPKTEGAYPGLILIQELWGLNDHIKDVTERYAEQGFNVLAPDLIGGTGILEKASPTLSDDLRNPEKRHEAQAKVREIMQPLSTKEFSELALAKLNASFEYLLEHTGGAGKVGVVGFCFGGTYAWQLAVHESRLAACIPFYGQPPQPLDDVSKISCPVLAFYGEQDENLMKLLPGLAEAMEKYNKDFTPKVYKNTGHAFFNDTNKRAFNKGARDDAWQLSLDFLNKHLD